MRLFLYMHVFLIYEASIGALELGNHSLSIYYLEPRVHKL
jgi:hypothetical protein